MNERYHRASMRALLAIATSTLTVRLFPSLHMRHLHVRFYALSRTTTSHTLPLGSVPQSCLSCLHLSPSSHACLLHQPPTIPSSSLFFLLVIYVNLINPPRPSRLPAFSSCGQARLVPQCADSTNSRNISPSYLPLSLLPHHNTDFQ